MAFMAQMIMVFLVCREAAVSLMVISNPKVQQACGGHQQNICLFMHGADRWLIFRTMSLLIWQN
jgi:hypothetical protein